MTELRPEDLEYFCDVCNRKVAWEELYSDVHGHWFLCPDCFLDIEQARARGGWVNTARDGEEESLHYFVYGVSSCLLEKIEGMPEYVDTLGSEHCFCAACFRIMNQVCQRIRRRDLL